MQIPKIQTTFVNRLSQHSPVSFNGATLLILGLGLIIGPGRSHYDIVAATFGVSIVTLALLLLFATLVSGLIFKINSSFRWQVIPARGEELHANSPATIQLLATHKSLAPLISPLIDVQLGNLPKILRFDLGSSAKQDRSISLPIVFPHRGEWRAKIKSSVLSDPLKLSSLNAHINFLDCERSVTVLPTRYSSPDLPLLTSIERVGDDLSAHTQRSGDPLDWKQYHPSDGAGRILWKSFARSGVLLSRFQESSITPEGRVAIFAPAIAADDLMASCVVDYCARLEESHVDISVLCSGSSVICKSSASILQELISSVWSSNMQIAELKSAIHSLISSLSTNDNTRQIKQIVIFTSPLSIDSESSSAALLSICQDLRTRGIDPIIMAVKERSRTVHRDTSKRGLSRLFINDSTDPSTVDDRIFQANLANCQSLGYSIYVAEVVRI